LICHFRVGSDATFLHGTTAHATAARTHRRAATIEAGETFAYSRIVPHPKLEKSSVGRAWEMAAILRGTADHLLTIDYSPQSTADTRPPPAADN